jgi:hypothetical protein
MNYYSRQPATHMDGSLIFQTAEDRAVEKSVAQLVETAWQCNVKPFGALSTVDWFAEENGRMVGVLELKNRAHASTKYPTVFLNVRKWLALQLAAIGLGCPAIFVVKFEDGVFWIPIADVDATNHRISGCSQARAVRAVSQVEPIIEVDISAMRKLDA